jgi:hypothetical protein
MSHNIPSIAFEARIHLFILPPGAYHLPQMFRILSGLFRPLGDLGYRGAAGNVDTVTENVVAFD